MGVLPNVLKSNALCVYFTGYRRPQHELSKRLLKAGIDWLRCPRPKRRL